MHLIKFKAGAIGDDAYINPEEVTQVQSDVAGNAGLIVICTSDGKELRVQGKLEDVVRILNTD